MSPELFTLGNANDFHASVVWKTTVNGLLKMSFMVFRLWHLKEWMKVERLIHHVAGSVE